MKKPLISIIIRSKNSVDTLERVIDSVLSQKLTNATFEVIWVDDGSEDATVAKLVSCYPQVSLIETDSIGAVAALNEGLKHARGIFYTILDADDALPHQALQSLLNCISDDALTAAVYGNYQEIGINLNQKKFISTANNMYHTIAGGIMFRLKNVAKSGYYDESLFFPEYDLLTKLQSNYRVVHCDKSVYYYFRRSDSLTSDSERVSQGLDQLFQKYKKQFPIRQY